MHAHNTLVEHMTATQVLHNSPELGGDAVQEPCEESPGVYVGMPHTAIANHC